MAIMKHLTIECLVCGYSDEFTDCDQEFDEWAYDEGEKECPNCMKLAAENL